MKNSRRMHCLRSLPRNRDYNWSQSLASMKSLLANGRSSIWNLYWLQIFAVEKCFVANWRNRVWNWDRFHGIAHGRCLHRVWSLFWDWVATWFQWGALDDLCHLLVLKHSIDKNDVWALWDINVFQKKHLGSGLPPKETTDMGILMERIPHLENAWLQWLQPRLGSWLTSN